MAASLSLFGLARWLHFGAAHVVFAISTSLTAWINSSLLLRRLLRDGIYRPLPGWSGFALRLLLATAAMAALLLVMLGDLQGWLAAGTLMRVQRVAAIVMAAVAVYFGMLWLCGLRPRHFREATG
jgi:putative peptidoglycan lipid II flippase